MKVATNSKPGKRDRTYSELVAATEKLVASRGLDAVSVDEIVEAAGVAKGTFYTHFADKTGLAAAIGRRTRLELEEKIGHCNADVIDSAQRVANGLAIVLAFAIASPERSRAQLRLEPGFVDPDAEMNAGLRADVEGGLKGKRFFAPSLNAAVVVTIGAVMAAIMRLTDSQHRVADGNLFATQIIATILGTLGLKPPEAMAITRKALAPHKDGVQK